MAIARRHRCPVDARPDAGGGVPVGGSAVTERSTVVVTPRPQGAVRLESQGVVTAGGYRHPVGVGPDAGGSGSVAGAAVAELAVVVVTPGPK